LLGLACFSPAFATAASADVEIGGGPIFSLTPIGTIDSKERVEIVRSKLEKVFSDPTKSADQIAVTTLRDGAPAVVLGGLQIVEVTPFDAELYDQPQADVANRFAEIIRSKMRHLQPLYVRQAKVNTKVLSENRVLMLVLQVAILLLGATIGGEIMIRLKQPPVIGQLLAGIVLGPTLLGAAFPAVSATFFPVERTQSYLLEVVSWLGVLFLLMLTGLETDLAILRRQLRPSLLASVFGSLIPFAVGAGVGMAIPDTLLVVPGSRFELCLFLGTLFAVSSVPVIAKILIDLNLMRTAMGQVTMAVALIQDVFACVALAIVASMVGNEGSGGGTVMLKAVGAILFVAIVYALRKPLVRAFRWLVARCRVEDTTLSCMLIIMLMMAAVTQCLGVHVVLGAFAAGVLLTELPELAPIVEPVRKITYAVFAPIFFAAAGLHVDLTILADGRLLFWAVILLVCASLSKIFGCFAGGRWAGLSTHDALGVGVGANARGAMGLIVGIIGFSLGILTLDLFSLLVLTALGTTALAPPLLKLYMHVPQTEAEENANDRSAAKEEAQVS
jgi:Kef-type K+ transport system membrane component KefB